MLIQRMNLIYAYNRDQISLEVFEQKMDELNKYQEQQLEKELKALEQK